MDKVITFTSGTVNYDFKIDNVLEERLNLKHCHDYYEILYVVKGSGSFLVEGAEFAMEENSLILIRPFEYHCVLLDEHCEYIRHVIHFTDKGFSKDIKEAFDNMVGGENGGSGVFYSKKNLDSKVIKIFDEFEEVNSYFGKEREIFLNLLVERLVFHLSVSDKTLIEHDEVELGARVVKYINDFIDKDNNLDFLSKKFFVSKYYLCHTFKKYTGVSIHSYINHKRVIYAKQLIDEGETASGAAYRVGFGDYSAFYRAYVKILGVPPTKEIRKTREVNNSKSCEEE